MRVVIRGRRKGRCVSMLAARLVREESNVLSCLQTAPTACTKLGPTPSVIASSQRLWHADSQRSSMAVEDSVCSLRGVWAYYTSQCIVQVCDSAESQVQLLDDGVLEVTVQGVSSSACT